MSKKDDQSVSKLRFYLAAWRAMIYGFEDKRADEMIMQQVLRQTSGTPQFDLCAYLLGKFGTVFSLPTLMAFSDDLDRARQSAIADANIEFLKRIKVSTSAELLPMFRQEWWKIKWVAPPVHFLLWPCALRSFITRGARRRFGRCSGRHPITGNGGFVPSLSKLL